MRCNHGDHTSRAEQEVPAAGLLDGIRGFFPDLGRVLIDKRSLSHASTGNTLEKLPRLCESWVGLAIMPVDDLKGQLASQLEVDILSVQVKHVAP